MRFLLVLAFFDGEMIEVIHRPVETTEACLAYAASFETSHPDMPYDMQCIDLMRIMLAPNPKRING